MISAEPSRLPRQLARSAYRWLKHDVLLGTLLVPYGRARQRELLQSVERSNSHTYTSFYRSPLQLEALVGPVLSHLQSRGINEPSILIFAGSNGAEAYTVASELMFRRPDLRFSIRATDLHAHTVEQARKGSYSLAEITQSLTVPQDFLERTFDRDRERYVVKPAIRAQVTFEQADLLDAQLPDRFAPADIVFAQNVLFHMPPALARRAFASILRFLKPSSVLFLDGMELDMRVELTQQAGLQPLEYKVKDIYEYSRKHVPTKWWEYYFGSEPYYPFEPDKVARYATIFTVSPPAKAE